MEYIVEKTQKSKKLSADEKLGIARKIVEDFTEYDDARNAQLEKSRSLMREIFFKSKADVDTSDESKSWKCDLKMCKLFMYYQILKAFIWKNVYASTNSMFDVSGENLEADNNSNKQKTMLVDILNRMDYPKTCDKIIDNSLIYGELISFTTWRKHSEEIRRPITILDLANPHNAAKALQAKLRGENFYTDERVDYDNPYVYEVDPENFVFDVSQHNNFDSAPKIYRTFKTPHEIISNKYFEISDEEAKDLKQMVLPGAETGDLSDQQASSHKNEYINGSTVEVLEHWGDLTLPDGTVLRNWYAVVAAGKYLIAFEKNPFIINPFTYGAYVLDPETKRAISPLYSIYELSLLQEQMLRHTVDMQSLTENPPVYAGKGFFGDDPGDVELHPGKIIEYDPNMYSTVPVQPMEFAVNVFANDLEYIDDLMSSVSGIFPNMAGATENDRTTATEISTKVEGQLTRLKMILDVINQNLVLENVKKIAKLKANFTFGSEMVFINNENEPENVEITDAIRQSDYRYTYADRSVTSERFNYVDMVAQAIQQFAKTGVPLNLQEIFTWYMEQKGVENPERFLQTQNSIDPQVQQALMQNPQLAPIIQAMTERVQMAKNGKKLPDEGNSSSPQQNAPQEPQNLSEKLNALPGRNLLNG